MRGSHNKLQTICLAVLIAGHLSELRSQSTSDMVSIPAGAFMMGTASGSPDERPVHIVELSSFLIDRTPVTKAQFALFLEAEGRVSPRGETYYEDDDSDASINRRAGSWLVDSGLDNHPVLEVTWIGARDYCAWAGKRLPTEAEWEKAARGTDGRVYPWGNQPPDQTLAQFRQGRAETSPVGRFPDGASPYGAVDLAGNVWEWVSSAYRLYPYDASDGREDLEPGPVRVTRGGGHDSSAEEIRSTERGRNLSRDYRSGHRNIGFRCAT